MITYKPFWYANQLQTAYDRLQEVLALLEAEEMEQAQLPSGWSPKSLLAHVAFWDDFQTRRMQVAHQGEWAWQGVTWPVEDNDQRAIAANQRPWAEVLTTADAARQRMIEFTQRLPADALDTRYPEGDQTLDLAALLAHMVRHTEQHAAEVRRYAGSMQRWSRALLRQFLVRNHTNLLDSISGLTEATVLATHVCGHWSIRDVLAHVLSWNEFGYLVAKPWPDKAAAASLLPWLADEADVDRLNDNLLAARADLDIIAIVDGLTTYHRRVLRLFDKASDDLLATNGEIWFGESGPLSELFYGLSLHEVEHAEQIWRYRAGV
jgi:uncharacterized damage-inducible protein DinB